MNKSWKTYSVFVSSTFSDMQAERDYLRTQLLPEVNDILKKHAIKLRLIDLRWGINTLESDECTIEEKVLQVCLNEIKRSRPFFLGLLGDRYGWIPPYEKMRKMSADYLGKSITDIEITNGFLEQEQILGAWFMERDCICYDTMNETSLEMFTDNQDADADLKKEKLKSLKETIKIHLSQSGRLHCYGTYSPVWNGESFVGLEQFGNTLKEMMVNDILALNQSEYDDTPFVDEQRMQDGFFDTMEEIHYTQERYNETLLPNMEEALGVFSIVGKPGSGKSHAYYHIYKHFLAKPNVVLYHSTDIGQNSRDVHQMLERWIYLLEQHEGIVHLEITGNKSAIVQRFVQLMYQVSQRKSLVMLIDGIEKFYESPEGEYLNFFPRRLNKNLKLICTCDDTTYQKISSLHKSSTKYQLDNFAENDAQGLIEAIQKYESKEIYKENIATLLQRETNGTHCYKEPLWLSIAINYMLCLDQNDFQVVKEKMMDNENSFDKSLITYINERITHFSPQHKDLFREYIASIGEYYGNLPMNLINYLSVSYNGLEEDTLALLLGKDWNTQVFARVRNFLQEYLSEQSQLKLWMIAHDSLKLELPETESIELCSQIAQIYMEKLKVGDVVNDNVFYYLLMGKQYDLANIYFLGIAKNETFINNEVCDVATKLGHNVVMHFLITMFDSRKIRAQKKLPRFARQNYMKRLSFTLIDKCVEIGLYKRALDIVQKYHSYIENEPMPRGKRTLYYILSKSRKFDAMNKIFSDGKIIEEYHDYSKKLKIGGLITLFFVPLYKRYIKWNIYKLQN